MSGNRLLYIDNLRIFLICLVVLHHLAITYGAPGGWYYNESQAQFSLILPMAMFTSTNQSFFMGMFFFISAFFIVPSLNRKGLGKFIVDRLIRLGIPTGVFYFLISPFAVYVLDRFMLSGDASFWEVLEYGWGRSFGPMWFVEALILFTAIFLILGRFIRNIKLKAPSELQIIAGAVIVGLSQFLIRIWVPVGTSHAFTNFQFPFFVQYVFLFFFGIVAWQNNWMVKITYASGKRWFLFAQLMVLIGFPALFFLGGFLDHGTEPFMGGLTWQSLCYSIYEQITGFSLIVGLFGIFKFRFNRQGNFTKKLSDGAYGVYIFHTPILVVLSALFLNWEDPQFLKFLALSPLALLMCFVLALMLKFLPPLRRIL